jgi:uncharacterized membrane protein
MSLFELFIYSIVPVTEQRATIPLGIIAYGYDPFLVTLVCFLGTLLPVPFILLFFNKAFETACRIKFLDPVTGYINKKVRKNSKRIEMYKEIGLMIFVGIPLPGTGVWTGSAAAAFLGLDIKKSLLSIIAGNLISAVLLCAASIFFPAVLGSIG